MKNIERRYYPLAELRVDSPEGENRPKIVGYAALYDSLSEDLGGFREVIKPGAFAPALGCDVRALVDHDSSKILGRTKSGTLRLAEDDRGLRVEIDPPDTQVARDLLESLRRGDVDQMSFAFSDVEDTWIVPEEDGQSSLRQITSVRKLYDVSPVTFPAYPETSVAMRSLSEWQRHQPRPRLERARKYFAMMQ